MKDPMTWTQEESVRFSIRTDAQQASEFAKAALEAHRVGLMTLDYKKATFYEYVVSVSQYVLDTVEKP